MPGLQLARIINSNLDSKDLAGLLFCDDLTLFHMSEGAIRASDKRDQTQEFYFGSCLKSFADSLFQISANLFPCMTFCRELCSEEIPLNT